MSRTLHDKVRMALASRSQWELRQSRWQEMRHDGERRQVRPWKGAADMHFPLADMLIEKMKPAYVQQAFAGDTVASFTGLDSDGVRFQVAASQWFDHVLKQRSNFEDFIVRAVDAMLISGRAPVKIRWNSAKSRLEFTVVPPLRFIVPPWTRALQDADWICQVHTISVDEYMRTGIYDKDPDLVRSITGRGSEAGMVAETNRRLREGVTHSDQEMIVIWEIWHRDDKGRWIVSTASPLASDKPLRPDFACPYALGPFAEGASPFGSFTYELKDDAWHSPRGIPERVAPFESSLNKLWNTQMDWLTLTCQPLFYTPSGGLENNASITFRPGQILPYEVKSVEFPPSPTDLPMQMQQARGVAEQLITVPDFGLGAASGAVGHKGAKTATEASIISQVMGNNTELRSRIFRRELGELLRMAWAICAQHMGEDLAYYFDSVAGELDPAALKANYAIEPNGSGDSANRPLQIQKAYARLQAFGSSPFVDQGELVKSALEVDDPRLVRRVFRDPQQKSTDQMEDQAQELSVMAMGFPAQVRPTDDHVAHLQCMAGFVQRRLQMGEPIDPELAVLITQHGMQHLEILKKSDPAAAKQFAPIAQEMMQMGVAAAQALQLRQQAMAQKQQQQAGPQQQQPQQAQPPQAAPASA